MIQPLRAWHRRIFAALAVALPAIFAAALLVRPAAPARENAFASAGLVKSDTQSPWKSRAISVRLHTTNAQRAVKLIAAREILEPDILVYVAPKQPAKSLPEGSHLLGPFRSGHSYSLPADISPGSALVLYSGARHEVLDSAPLGVAP